VWGAGNSEEGGLGRGWVKGGQFTSNLRARWTDPVTATVGGFQVSERGSKGEQRGDKRGRQKEAARGDKKKGECAMYIVIYAHVYERMPETLNDISRVYT
jgi:hypothetical protein